MRLKLSDLLLTITHKLQESCGNEAYNSFIGWIKKTVDWESNAGQESYKTDVR